jgi:hypothetical protein
MYLVGWRESFKGILKKSAINGKDSELTFLDMKNT